MDNNPKQHEIPQKSDPVEETGRKLLASIGWNPEDFQDSFLQHFPRSLREDRPLPDACGSIGRIVDQFKDRDEHSAVLKALTSGPDDELSFQRQDRKGIGITSDSAGHTELTIMQNGSPIYSELWDNQIQHKAMVVCKSGQTDYTGLPLTVVHREPVE